MSNPSFVLQKVNEVSFEDRPVPEIKDPHYVKIAVKKTGICGSDVHYYTHGAIGDFVVKAPMVLGHESAGVIVEVGSEVKNLKVGDRVAMEPGVPSRYSDEYKSGRYNLCPCMAFAATPPYDGTLAKYYLLPEDYCVKLPDHVSLDEGALVEPLAVGVHSSKLADVRPGSKVAVFGAGPVGLLITAVASAFGASSVTVIDIVQNRLDLAKELGATHTVLASIKDTSDETAKKVVAATGAQPDIVLDASGAESSINAAISAIKPGGTYVQVGMGKPNVNFPIANVIGKELTIKGSFRYGYGDYPLAVELISSGKVNVKKLISHTVKFEEAKEAFELVMSGKAVKVIIDGPQ
ncbi:L-iditol 2-dehydrogenase SOR1 [Sugiyamaella lignohabitans]|uniref:L-iditol 2-dehydrogenase SOR1 n=1 Tax=Sugiyamaella lignohabitans TaxID=796027 RepID=A0A167EEZ6_9ASCO|nr:L-iditol 2-dehydrogenase SOR1 [Sugiyamaella lignohabitans]ANB13992.1 L-iditol 2-dehydrogenase SOR1 [Sugiyamaella lignohabitans]